MSPAATARAGWITDQFMPNAIGWHKSTQNELFTTTKTTTTETRAPTRTKTGRATVMKSAILDRYQPWTQIIENSE
jgi:hypothetical protein